MDQPTLHRPDSRRPGRGALAVALALLVTLPVGLAPAPAWAGPARTEPAPQAAKVLMFSLPRVTWADFATADVPHLTRLFSHSMLGKLSQRTAGPRTSAADGYATIGAGARATGVAEEENLGGLALRHDEPYDGRPASLAYQARVGRQPDGQIVHLGLPAVRRVNDAYRYGAHPGALGSALDKAGLSTAVVGNADGPESLDRAAALALMDRYGVVDGGDVSTRLLRTDPTAPDGATLDHGSVLDVFDAAWAEHEVTLVEASDTERVDRFEDLALPGNWRKLRREALADADRLLGKLLERVDLDRDLVMVVSPAAPHRGEELGVFAMAGPGVEPGIAVSGTTRRPGYLTLPDVAPTVLTRLAVTVPASMVGTPIKLGRAQQVDRAMISDYATANRVAVFRNQVAGAVTLGFIALQLVAYLLASLVLWPRRRATTPAEPVAAGRRTSWRRVARFLLLVVLALPTTTFLSGMVRYDLLGGAGYVAALALASAGIAGLSMWAGRLVRPRLPAAAPVLPPLLIVTLTWLTLILDVMLYDGRLQMDTVFGYSPIVAGRFSGYGNFAFSLLAMCALIMATAGWAIAGRVAEHASRWRLAALLAVAVVLGVTVVVDGHPTYGSDVGGVLAAVPAFTVAVLLLAGVRVTWRRLALVGLLTVGVIGVFAMLDVMRPAGSRTHLGRLVARFGDPGAVATILERKLFANLGILTSSIWTWVVPIAIGFLLVLARRPRPPRDAAQPAPATGPEDAGPEDAAPEDTRPESGESRLHLLVRRMPGMRACLWGSLVVAVLGFALNDSGIAVPAMMSTMLMPYLGHLILAQRDRESHAPASAQGPVSVPAPASAEAPASGPTPSPGES